MSTANKLTYLNITKSKIKDAINLAGTNITNEPFRQYADKLYNKYIDIINNGTDNLYNSLPKVTGTGNELTLQNTANAKMKVGLSASESTQNNAILPSEYQQVEYIESSGTQYIDTGFNHTTNTTGYDFDIEVTSLTNTYHSLYGARSSSNGAEAYYIGVFKNGNAYGCCGGNKKDALGWTVVPGVRYSVNVNPATGVTVNGTTYAMEYNTAATYSDSDYIFALNQRGPIETSSTKLYKFRIYDNNVLVRDFIPCYRKNGNVIGMYDLVNNTFYTNAGTGTFAKGNDVSIPNPDYPQEINVVTGENEVKIQNKNLFDKDSVVYQNDKILNDTGVEINDTGGGYTKMYIKVAPSTQYTVSGLSSYSGIKRIYFFDSSKNFISRSGGVSSSTITITTPNNCSYIDIQYYVSGNDFNNYQLEQDTNATSFVEHQEQTFPLSLGTLELAKIGEYKDEIIETSGKNLFDPTKVINDSNNDEVYITQDGNFIRFKTGGIRLTYYPLNIKENTQYTFTIKIKNGANSNDINFTAFYSDGTNSTLIARSYNANEEYTFTATTENGKTLEYIRSGYTVNYEAFIRIVGSEINEGPIAADYEPFGTGEWYKKKRIIKYTFDGTENWGQSGSSTQRFVLQKNNLLTNENIVLIKSNMYRGIFFKNATTDIDYTCYSHTNFLGFNTKNIISLTEWKSFLSNNNVMAYAVLYNPTYEQITDTTLISQLNAIKNAVSYVDQTNISQTNANRPFEISASAIKNSME